MSVKRLAEISLGAAILFCGADLNLAHAKPFMIVGNDEKVWWDDDGKTLLSAPGKDTVLIVDLANPESPEIVATLPLENSIVGPPVNLDIDPSGSIALVAIRFARKNHNCSNRGDVVVTTEEEKTIWDGRTGRLSAPRRSPPKSHAAAVVGVSCLDAT
jgi:hypothetical protein